MENQEGKLEMKDHYLMINLFFQLIIQLKFLGCFFLHWGKVVKGTVNIGDQVTGIN